MAYISVPSIWRAIPQKYRLVGIRCKNCGIINFPPRKICKKCRKPTDFEEVKLRGRGKVYAYTVIGHGATVFEHTEEGIIGGAFPIAIIELEEGVRVLGQITDCDPSEIKIGTKVEAVLRRMYDQNKIIRYGYKFRPVRFRSLNGVEQR